MATCSFCGADVQAGDAFCRRCGSRRQTAEDQENAEQYQDTLLIEWVADRSGVTRLTDLLSRDVYPPYLFVGIGIFVAFGLLPVLSYVTVGFHSALANPFRPITIAVGLVFSVTGIRYMTNRYARAINNLDLNRRQAPIDQRQFQCVVNFRFKVLAYGLVVGVYYLSLLIPTVTQALGISTDFALLTALSGRDIQTLISAEGVVTTVVGQLIIVPLVNIPVILEFVIMFFGIHFLLPVRVSNANFELFFHDPRNMAGLSDIGQLLKRSYYLYTGGVLLYFFVAYGPVVYSHLVNTPRPTPGTGVIVFFSLIWVIGLGSVVFSFTSIHRVMVSKKEQRLRELESDIKALVENPFDIRSSRVTDTQVMETKERQLRQVQSTRTYPATFRMWWQLGLSVLLPQALQVAVQTIL